MSVYQYLTNAREVGADLRPALERLAASQEVANKLKVVELLVATRQLSSAAHQLDALKVKI